MYRMAILAMLITDSRVNKDKLVKSKPISTSSLSSLVTSPKVCLMHDFAEARVGDITPYERITKEEKRKLEEVFYGSIRAVYLVLIVTP